MLAELEGFLATFGDLADALGSGGRQMIGEQVLTAVAATMCSGWFGTELIWLLLSYGLASYLKSKRDKVAPEMRGSLTAS